MDRYTQVAKIVMNMLKRWPNKGNDDLDTASLFDSRNEELLIEDLFRRNSTNHNIHLLDCFNEACLILQRTLKVTKINPFRLREKWDSPKINRNLNCPFCHYTNLFRWCIYRCSIKLIFWKDDIVGEVYKIKDSEHFCGPETGPNWTPITTQRNCQGEGKNVALFFFLHI